MRRKQLLGLKKRKGKMPLIQMRSQGPDDKMYGVWDALIKVISKHKVGDIISNDDARAAILKEMNQTAWWSFNTYYSYTYLLAKCNIIIKLGKTKQFNNKCGGFEIIRQVEPYIRHKDIKKLQKQPSWMLWFSDPEVVITRKGIRSLLKQLEV